MIMRHIDRWLENITHRAIIDGLEVCRRDVLIARPERKQAQRLTVGKAELLAYQVSASIVATVIIVGTFYGLIQWVEGW